MKQILNQNTVSSFLVQQLYNLGVRHVFGVPGDYVLGFYQYLNESKKLMVVNTCDEQGAGFAADAYARISGLGVVCITYIHTGSGICRKVSLGNNIWITWNSGEKKRTHFFTTKY